MSPSRIVIFARYPEPGRAKTRTIPALGPAGAARLQGAGLDRILREAAGVSRPSDRAADRCDVEVRCTGATAEVMRQQFGSRPHYVDHYYVDQGAGDLGQRLERAVADAFAAGVDRLLVVGTDAPDLDTQRLREALAELENAPVVLGPALDGGYYLIGLRGNYPELFRGIDWSTERVLAQTTEAAAKLSLACRQMPPLSDVDQPEDLLACRRYPKDYEQVFGAIRPGVISVVIPALNEAAGIEAALSPIVGREDLQAIVVDGGSDDGTAEIARAAGAEVIACGRGRARQMNAGAAIARGETLLFLHADSRLPDEFATEVRAALRAGAIGGAFRLRIDDPRRVYRWIEFGTRLRTRWWGRPYGDQGLFIDAATFYRLSGFRVWPLMEDYEWVGRARREGRFVTLSSEVTTSARRWQRLGPLRTTLTNQAIVAAYHCGLPIDRLAQWYRS